MHSLLSSSIIGWKTVSSSDSAHARRMCAATSLGSLQPLKCFLPRANEGDLAAARCLNRMEELVGGAGGGKAVVRAGGVRRPHLLRNQPPAQQDGADVREGLVHELDEGDLLEAG